MGWPGRLTLRYHHDGTRTVSHDLHHGPLRVLQRLYPEPTGVCHHVLVHPPGGIVGGDSLQLDIGLAEGAHALVTTPGATRFYRSAGEAASQTISADLASGARLEWLPLETLVYSGALAENQVHFTLAPGAEMMGWDVLALGLPASSQAFVRGRYTQEIRFPGIWLERGRIDADDRRLLDSPLGWAGQRVMATLWFAAGSAVQEDRRQQLIDEARAVVEGSPLAALCGITSPHSQVLLLRVLAPRVEPAMQLLTRVWAAWRQSAWQLAPCPPRVWRT